MSLSISGRDGVQIDVTAVSSATLIAGDDFGRACEYCVVQNTGASACWVKAGHADAAATELSILMPPQWREVFHKGTATHLAAVCAPGENTTLVVAPVGGRA
ncbi:hypothetical protein Lcho_2258 [Leptothrix cholodnii SP-6]|uniref:Uncharacterized protein n=1 Tax=Leptothrix cholodnii (strain ATCC 51168 / LMG 8142 / SP-6) TaxID=395495 RepID=B1Y3J6_LEPCP|nr:hypothetical protein [Leptothrix cholodnii]ACB34524.1 hypothetical protein Lcho_2258 [Leptothrix cholodnii SP-6]